MAEGEYESFQVRESGALSVIRLATNPQTAVSNELQPELTDFVTRNSCQKLVIDLTATAYLPSSVIGILAMLCGRGVDVHLANASADVESVMEVLGLNKRIHVNEYILDAASNSNESGQQVSRSAINGYFLSCPACDAEQRIDKHLLGKSSKCFNCFAPLHVDAALLNSATQVYFTCPLCEREQKLAKESLNSTVNCEFCDGSIQVRKIL